MIESSRDERELNSIQTTLCHWETIRAKPFLTKIYEEWYQLQANFIPSGNEPVLEIGSGGGFLDRYVDNLIKSDTVALPDVDVTLDACKTWHFSDSSLRGVAMTNVLHHLPECTPFFLEAQRCLKPGGRLVMVEPWVTPWSRLIYANLHHEPFLPKAPDWHFKSTGRLSGANGALPWIIFERDNEKFASLFPNLRVLRVQPFMPFRYLLSGGVSKPSLVPSWSYSVWSALEEKLTPLYPATAMFAFIAIEKRQ